MYKQSQLSRLNRLAVTCRMATMVVLASSLLIFVVMLGPILTVTGQLILGLGTVIFAWILMLSRLRKQAATAQNKAQSAGKYSLDFD